MAILLGISSALLSASDAFSSQRFIGAEFGYAEVQGAHTSDTSDDFTYGIRLGARNDVWRTTFTFNYYDSKEHNVEKLLLSTDYFLIDKDKTDLYNFAPYIGMNIGYVNFESVGVEENGLVYGGQAGIVYSLIEDVNLDISYRYSLSAAKAMDHAGELIFGINYQY